MQLHKSIQTKHSKFQPGELRHKCTVHHKIEVTVICCESERVLQRESGVQGCVNVVKGKAKGIIV